MFRTLITLLLFVISSCTFKSNLDINQNLQLAFQYEVVEHEISDSSKYTLESLERHVTRTNDAILEKKIIISGQENIIIENQFQSPTIKFYELNRPNLDEYLYILEIQDQHEIKKYFSNQILLDLIVEDYTIDSTDYYLSYGILYNDYVKIDSNLNEEFKVLDYDCYQLQQYFPWSEDSIFHSRLITESIPMYSNLDSNREYIKGLVMKDTYSTFQGTITAEITSKLNFAKYESLFEIDTAQMEKLDPEIIWLTWKEHFENQEVK